MKWHEKEEHHLHIFCKLHILIHFWVYGIVWLHSVFHWGKGDGYDFLYVLVSWFLVKEFPCLNNYCYYLKDFRVAVEHCRAVRYYCICNNSCLHWMALAYSKESPNFTGLFFIGQLTVHSPRELHSFLCGLSCVVQFCSCTVGSDYNLKQPFWCVATKKLAFLASPL